MPDGTVFHNIGQGSEVLKVATIQYYYTSNIGRVRRTNQDNFLVPGGIFMPWDNRGTAGVLSGSAPTQERPVFAVFDGMGGEECGEIAAAIGVQTLANADLTGDAVQALQEVCFVANENICRYTAENNITSMGTTAAILQLTDDGACLCNIGDSKIFALSGGSFVQLSVDHVAIAPFGKKPPLSQNLGIPPEELIIEPFLATGNYFPGDVFLLCSDGLTDMVTPERIGQILSSEPGDQAAQCLLQEALENGGKDNVTFILLYVLYHE